VPAYIVLLVLLLVALSGAVGYFAGRTAGDREAVDAATVDAVRREITGLRSLVGRLKDLAWDQRELDPALATIVIDEIRTHEKKELEP
jgi:hypothetical protein